jgi:predicted tellurium resistance membrane protein TerC
MENLIALTALALMEIILGIDNIVFLAIVTARLPEQQRSLARRIGLLAAMLMRIALLLSINWLMQLKEPLFHLTSLGIPESILSRVDHWEQVNAVSLRDVILVLGGLFLLGKSVFEIHEKLEHHESEGDVEPAGASFAMAIVQIMILDIIFSLDSVITAVGMADELWVMIVAIMLAVGVMLVFANPISDFVSRHPSLTMLALSFLILIGVMLVAEGIGTHINKGYIYFAMAFSLLVEMMNLRIRSRKTH